MSDNKKEHSKIVEFDGQKIVLHKNKDGDVVITMFTQDYDTGVDCPPLPGDACSPGYYEECRDGTVWCIFDPS